ncbi:penicillin acylase family protein [Microbacterium sp. NPDC058389]|uniref:penicillin acylase family protein n=1 Tax=Microbacterium sp. NPDC058389 TaxID=3346475 RepID=UPI00364A3304
MADTRGRVEVRRAPSGTPLIEADDEAAAFFGLGYAQACDDLEGLMRQFLLVRAELSVADADAGMRDDNQRRWRVHEEAQAAFETLPAEMQACYRAFMAGIAERLAEVPDLVPSWAPPLDPWLPIGVNRTVMLFWVIADAVAALRAAGIELPSVVSELDRTPMTPGSNAWVLTPPRTVDGATILVSDPHLPFGDVYAMHEATIVTPSLHYTGFTFLGAMLPALAHNDAVAWGCTTGGPRVSDAYRVPDGGQQEVTINGLRSPVVARADGWAYAICSPYTDAIGETESQLLAMLRTRSVDELRTVLERRAFPPQNILAADRDGASLYVRTGRVPRRAATSTGILDLAQTWDGYLEPDELVHLDGAPSGYLQNCNSAPDTVAPEIRSEDWHADAFHDAPGRQTSRSERSIELLADAVGVDAVRVTAWAVEDRWPDTPQWRAALAAAISSHPARVACWDEERSLFADDLVAFDGNAAPDSTCATAWLAWRTAVARTPEAPDRLRERVDALDPELLLDAVERAVIDRRPYGEVHRMASGEPGRGGAFMVRPPANGDVQPSMQVPLRATYFKNGVAFAGGPALRIVRFDLTGMTSWSLLLPRRAAEFSRGEVLPTPFRAADTTLERSFPAGPTPERQRIRPRHTAAHDRSGG